MQVKADTFPHVMDTLARGVTASLPGGGKTSAIFVVVAIVALNIVLILAALRGFKAAGGIKAFLADFPSHNATTALAGILLFETGLVVLIRLALGLIFPDGYDTWIYALVGLSGFNVAGLIGKRLTDDRYVAAKALGKASSGPSLNIEGDATISATAERPAAAPTPKPPPTPLPAADPPRKFDLGPTPEQQAANVEPAVDNDPGII